MWLPYILFLFEYYEQYYYTAGPVVQVYNVDTSPDILTVEEKHAIQATLFTLDSTQEIFQVKAKKQVSKQTHTFLVYKLRWWRY